LKLKSSMGNVQISGSKRFCTGAGLVDRALITVGFPDSQLVEIDLHENQRTIHIDHSSWITRAFEETRTSTVIFDGTSVPAKQIGDSNWYVESPGFWHGACGPAACWAGGALGLVDYALAQKRLDAHSLAHLGAMQASAWALRCFLESAGNEIDSSPNDAQSAHIRALSVRHLVEQACTDILRRLPRAYGPHPLAMDKEVSIRYQELDLYLRQCHAERDLESLGCGLRKAIDGRHA
jgi:alkylation response protein AidB-like acyl-CoA dehydrogenase